MHTHAHACCLHPLHLARLIPQHEYHDGCHADIPSDDIDIIRIVQSGTGKGDGMTKRREVGDKVGAA